ncbi:zinc finger protein 58 [Arthroderma uncinatum]|uniref:zinc finger protein 58 n=1 Tax=Arthroderma uncinatum TaxID=74035 RepID=UPI00144A81AE|nr:zinc finger protein 58 [Arthroderma uncinatum]KAF3481306.1 zinc finger protein 58 [Arthroderma uncinatum]
MIRDGLVVAQPHFQLIPDSYANALGSAGTHHIMDITTILNKKASISVVAADVHQLQQHLAQATDAKSRSPSEMGSEHGSASGPPSDHQNTYPSSTQSLPQMAHLAQYHAQAQANSHGMNGSHNNYAHSAGDYARNGNGSMRPSGLPALKTFHCQTCSKGFARRSDLARHERIHSGIRPHACDWPGCGKQFIQRSALTVHTRVHTGEKPHMCDRCGKPFSDSSSLARHRRIHSGKRPYKCPYANCQKTFTRRTTLTRHQNHHTGTIEEAAAETEANLRHSKDRVGRPSEYSETGSAHSTPSPAQRPSLSPGNELPPLNLSRPSGDYYMGHTSLPPHLRTDFQQPSPRASPTAPSPTLTSLSGPPSYHNRPSLTSHPSGYGPPQPLEPPANSDPRPNSVAGSPHLSSVGWASPTLSSMPSPSSASAPEYTYPEPSSHQYPGGITPHMFFSSQGMRRPQSSEPENYDMKPKLEMS